MRNILLLGLLLAAAPAWAQTPPALSPRFDQYAILDAGHRTKNRVKLELLTGTAAFPTPAPTQQAEEAARVKTFEYEADALNYLSSRGWEVISATSRDIGNTGLTRYYLRRRGGQ